jgi:hypothetical protein
LPLYSTLKPNESERIQLTFYGHSGVRAKAIARCSVVGGPEYDLMLEGSASLASYFFNKKNVNFGKQVGVQRKSTKSFPSFFYWLSICQSRASLLVMY